MIHPKKQQPRLLWSLTIDDQPLPFPSPCSFDWFLLLLCL